MMTYRKSHFPPSCRFGLLATALAIGLAGCGDDGASADDDTGGDGDADSDSDADADADADEHLFPKSSIWYQDRTGEPPHPQSEAVIAWMSQAGNSFEPDGEFRIDLSIKVLHADDSVPFQTFEKTADFYESTCDYGDIPVPPGGSLEGHANTDYRCQSDGDCHLIVVHKSKQLLFEMWRADITGGTFDSKPFYGGCLAIWDLTRDYGWNLQQGLDYERMGRGNDCASGDAAGYPIAPLLFTPEECAAGEIDHALRFILPNRNIRERIYVAPATHSTNPTAGGVNAPPYGAQFRLKPDADLKAAHPEVDFDNLPIGARAVITALQKYGMFLADGGAIALTGMSDFHSNTKYCDHDLYEWCDEDPNRLLHEHDLKFIRVSDFEMLDNGGPERTWTGDCTLLYHYDNDSQTVIEN